MKGIRPCPYCGGEVEVIKLHRKPGEKEQYYRIECLRCRALVARGLKFKKESRKEAEERIRQYEKIISYPRNPESSAKIRQTETARKRDKRASLASGIDIYNDEGETWIISEEDE